MSRRRRVRRATDAGIDVYKLQILRETFKAERNACPQAQPASSLSTEAYGAPVQFLAVADAEARLVCGLTNGTVLVYEVASMHNAPRQVAPPQPNTALTSLKPNPGERGELCLAVYAASTGGGSAYVLDIRAGEWRASLPEANVTAADWSTKGKQLVLGLRSGEIAQLTPEGEAKARLAAPPEADRPLYVEDVLWLENHVFLVTYNTVSDELTHEYDVYVVLRDAKAQSCTYAQFPLDVAPPFGDTSRRGTRYLAALRAWDKEKHLVFIASGPSTDVGVIECKTDAAGVAAWNVLELEDTSRPALPFSSVDESSDTSPVALALDLTATEPIADPNAAAKGEDPAATLPATPILLVYTSDGVLLAYNVINADAKDVYPGMVHATQGAAQGQAPPPPSSATAFGSTSTPSAAAFGSTSTPSASAFGSTSTPSAPAFGSTSTPGAPAFGSTSGPSAFGKPAFGQTASGGGFGAFGGAKSAFGSSSGSAFGAAGNTNSAPAFGSTSTPSAFGSTASPSAFGSASGTSAFGSPAFGQSSGSGAAASKPSAFGTTATPAFGQSSAFDKPSTPGSTGTNSAFSSMAGKPTGFGAVSSSNSGSVFGSGGAFDKGKPAFEGATPAPKPEPESGMEAEPIDDGNKGAFSFGSMNDMMDTKPAQESTPTPNTPSAPESRTTPASTPSAFGFAASQPKPSAGFSFGQSAPKAPEPVTPTKAREQKQAPAFSFANPEEKKDRPAFSFAKPDEKEEKKDAAAFSFAKPEEKKDAPAFSFAKPEEKKGAPSFSFAKPDEKKDEKKDAPAFSFAKPEAQKNEKEEKKDAPAFSFSKPEEKQDEKKEEKKDTPAFSFAKPDTQKDDKEAKEDALPALSAKPAEKGEEEKDAKDGPAFSFSKPEEKKEDNKDAPAFSFSKPEKKQDEKKEDKKDAPAFSFAKPEEKKEENKNTPSFSFAKPETKDEKKEEKKGTPSFYFAKPEEKKDAPAFSFAKPDDGNDNKKDTAAFSFAKPGEKSTTTPSKSEGKKDEKKDAPSFSFAKPEDKNEEQKSAPAFSFSNPEKEEKKDDTTVSQPEDKKDAPAFSVAKPEEKSEEGNAPAFSFTKSEGKKDETKNAPAFSFAKPEEKKEDKKDAPTFSFAKPEEKKEDKKDAPTFSFAKPEEKKEETKPAPAFSFAKPDEKKGDSKTAPAFSFAGPEDKKGETQGGSAFSFAKPDEKKDAPAFSFAKSEEKNGEQKSAPAFSFAKSEKKEDAPPTFFSKPDEKKEEPRASPAFSFAKPEEKKDAPAFSFAKSEPKEADKAKSAPAFSFASQDKPKESPAAKRVESNEMEKQSGDKPRDASFFAKSEPASAIATKEKSPEAPAKLDGVPLQDIKVPRVHLSSLPAPSVPAEEGELQREFAKIYLGLNAELDALKSQAKETAAFYDKLRTPSAPTKHTADLDSPTWTMGDLSSLTPVAQQLSADIAKVDRAFAENQQRVAGLQSVQLKAEIKRDETTRFLRARKDPSFAKLVRVRHLGPEHVENQQRLRRSTHLVRERMQELDEHLQTIKTAIANDKAGRQPMHAPSLDSVYRSADHITTLAARRLAELDRLNAELNELRPSAAPEIVREPSVPLTPRKTSGALDSIGALHNTLPAVSNAADAQAERDAQRAAMQTLLTMRDTPLLTNATMEASLPADAKVSLPVTKPIALRGVVRSKRPPAPKPAPCEVPESAAVPTEEKKEAPVDFFATSTPSGVSTPMPATTTPVRSPSFFSSLTSNKQALHSSHVPAQYTTFEGLVPPRRISPPTDLTLDEFVAQNGEDDDDDDDDDDYDDYDDDYGEDEDEDEDEEAYEDDDDEDVD